MNNLIEFISAENWQDKIYVDPDEVVLITRFYLSHDMSQYSSLSLRNGNVVNVSGSPTVVAKTIRDNRSSSSVK